MKAKGLSERANKLFSVFVKIFLEFFKNHQIHPSSISQKTWEIFLLSERNFPTTLRNLKGKMKWNENLRRIQFSSSFWATQSHCLEIIFSSDLNFHWNSFLWCFSPKSRFAHHIFQLLGNTMFLELSSLEEKYCLPETNPSSFDKRNYQKFIFLSLAFPIFSVKLQVFWLIFSISKIRDVKFHWYCFLFSHNDCIRKLTIKYAQIIISINIQ